MTKFIVHGGETKINNSHNNNFFREIIRGLEPPIKILDVSFARGKRFWSLGLMKDKKKFEKAAEKKKIEIVLAKENSQVLRNQIKKCDIVFIIGGIEMECLKANFKKLKNIKCLLKGKVIVGSSAGAYILSKYYYTKSRNRVEKGFGILPIKTIAHYDKKKNKDDLAKLKNTGENLRIYKIPETQYKIIKAKI